MLIAWHGPARASNENWPESVAWQKAMTCIQEGGDQVNCLIKASPRRCEAQAINLVSNRSLWQRPWVMCIRSCQKAGLWDRTLGDCS